MKFPQGFLMKRNLPGQVPREEVDDKVSNNPIRSTLRFESRICASLSKLSKFIRQEA